MKKRNIIKHNLIIIGTIITLIVSMLPGLMANAASVTPSVSSQAGGKNAPEIVVFGDSIWAQGREEGHSASNYLARYTKGNVHNCAIGGTCAALSNGESSSINLWDSESLTSFIYAARGQIDGEWQFRYHPESYQELAKADFSKTDYFVIAYGLNDYFSQVPVYPADLFDLNTYVGTLRHACFTLHQSYPNAKIILMTPTYCSWWYFDQMIEDSNTRDFGQGTLPVYVNAVKEVGAEYNAYVLDAYNDFGFNYDNIRDYYVDGIHFNDAGKQKYASQIAALINYIEEHE